MVECDFCGEEFDSERELHRHWDEHRDELNSHQKDKLKKAEREHQEEKKEKMRKRKTYAGYGLAALVGLALVGVVGAQVIDTGGGSNTASTIDTSGEPVIGNKSAEVTIVEYGDFQCPVCAQFNERIYPQLKQDYIDTGKAKFVWKDFPLDMHEWAGPAARTMECVSRQDEDAFWSVKNTLFANQDTITTSNVQSQIISWAEDEGVEPDSVRQCLNSDDPGSEVQGDYREGLNTGVSGTPTVYINGEQVNWQNYGAIQSKIDNELN